MAATKTSKDVITELYTSLAAAFPGQVVNFSTATRDGSKVGESVYSDRMTGELKDSHTRVESPERVALRKRDESITLGFSFRVLEGKLVVTGVHAESDEVDAAEHLRRVNPSGAWRMMVLVKQLDAAQPVELRGYLQNGEHVLTETWSNLVPPR